MEEFNFSGQKKEEKVILIMKQHPWVIVKPAFKILVVVIVTTIAVKISLGFSSTMGFPYIFGLIGLVLLIYAASKNYFVWQNSILVLTSSRLIIVDQNGWFNRTVTETNLENILTINHVIKGPVRTMLNFGDLNIRASGVVEDEIIFYDVYNPYDMQQAIIKAQSELKNKDENNSQKNPAPCTAESQDDKRPILR